MRSMLTHRKRGGKRTSRRGVTVPAEERRRLLQLGVSLVVFTLALLGRSAFPGQMEKWSGLLTRDIDLGAALTRFEETTAQGEPFLDALGELCIQVFAAEDGTVIDAGASEGDAPAEDIFEHAPEPAQRFRIWDEYRESQWQSE